jgi:hypothetical protein
LATLFGATAFAQLQLAFMRWRAMLVAGGDSRGAAPA